MKMLPDYLQYFQSNLILKTLNIYRKLLYSF